MPKQTFLNLSPDKKERITQALLHEFSSKPLSQAQVAPIVKEAQIARGAFYKYFEDLPDAYTYLYKQAMVAIHGGADPKRFAKMGASEYVSEVADFVNQAQNSDYYELVRLHVLYNEDLLSPPKVLDLPPQIWAAAQLAHGAIRQCFTEIDKKEQILGNLKVALEILLAK